MKMPIPEKDHSSGINPRALLLVTMFVSLLSTNIAFAALFSCDEAGVDSAISLGGGPHFFLCAGPTNIVVSSEKILAVDVELNGGGDLSLDGSALRRVISVNSGVTVHLGDLTITGGFSSTDGGGVRNDGNLTLEGVTLANNAADGSGAAIWNLGTLLMIDSLVSGNVAQCDSPSAGAILNDLGADMTIEASTIAGNSKTCTFLSPGAGAGIGNFGTLVVMNATISGNMMFEGIGGGGLASSSSAHLTHVTFSENTTTGFLGGDSILCEQDTTTLENSIVDGTCFSNVGCVAGIVSGGGNVESPGNTCGLNSSGDQNSVSEVDLALDVLANNQGPTDTHALLAGSVAIDAALSGICPGTDQRGFTRPGSPGGPECDVGAYEVPEPGFSAMLILSLSVAGPWLAQSRRRRGLL